MEKARERGGEGEMEKGKRRGGDGKGRERPCTFYSKTLFAICKIY